MDPNGGKIMKKIIVTSLLLIAPLCKAADDRFVEEHLANATQVWVENTAHLIAQSAQNLGYYGSIYKAYLLNSERLDLSEYGLKNVPQELNLPQLRELSLNNNQIQTIDPDVLAQFPHLERLSLNQNYLSEDNIVQLREYAVARDNLTIIFGKQKYGLSIKRTRR